MLSSETFQRRAKAKFSAEMWTDADDLERKIYKSKKKVAGWTTNGREVAYYTEDIDIVGEMPNKWIHYIAEDGTSSSRDESFNDWYYYGSSGSGRQHMMRGDFAGNWFPAKVEGMWILRHVILVQIASEVYAMDKEMKQSPQLLFSEEDEEFAWSSIFMPDVGVRFVTVEQGGDSIEKLLA